MFTIFVTVLLAVLAAVWIASRFNPRHVNYKYERSLDRPDNPYNPLSAEGRAWDRGLADRK
jgi:hypothetical protein